MIRNEKYVGDLIVQKFVTEDHITHRIRLNEGAAPSKYIRDHHEPIVSRKQFERCNTIFKLKTQDSTGGRPVPVRGLHPLPLLRAQALEEKGWDTAGEQPFLL